jgi:hypothetical protein
MLEPSERDLSAAPNSASSPDVADEREAALRGPADGLPAGEMFPISRLLYEAWAASPRWRDYPLFTAESRARFLYWVLTGGAAELGVSQDQLPWRELLTPAPNAFGGRLPLAPLHWLIWMTRPAWRQAYALNGEQAVGRLLCDMAGEVRSGALPPEFLPADFAEHVVLGQGEDALRTPDYALWASRDDLRKMFDVESADGRRRFLGWRNSEVAGRASDASR